MGAQCPEPDRRKFGKLTDPGLQDKNSAMFDTLPRQMAILISAMLIAICTAMPTSASMDDFELYALKPGDYRYLELARERVEDLAGRHFGARLSGARDHDIAVIQRLLDEDIVTAGDIKTLQDMGMVLGELLKQELSMHWVFYVDNKGKSRALQLRHSRHFLFPVTMISRRAETGLRVDVATVYNKAKAIIEPHRFDFSDQKYRHLQKHAR